MKLPQIDPAPEYTEQQDPIIKVNHVSKLYGINKAEAMQKDYKPVQDWYNLGKYSGPTKIPGAALELDMSEMGKVVDNHLYLDQALNEITWDKGIVLQQFVHATQPVGMFLLSNVN